MQKRRILFVPFGTEGDVNPLIWLAEGMAARGHEPIFIITPHYGPLVANRGFQWIPVGTEEEFVQAVRNPLAWHPQWGPHTIVQAMIDTLPAYRDVLQTIADIDLVVTSSIGLAATTVAEAKGWPYVHVHMQPTCLRSVYDCPVFMDELEWICHSPRWVKKLFFQFVDFFLQGLALKPLNAFRRELGVPPLKDFFLDAINGGPGVAGLFPSWFAAPQPDWPAQFRQLGFPLSASPAPLPPEVADFLAAGSAPVVWTHGSANFDIQHFQKRAIEVSNELGIRSILVSLDTPPQELPPGVVHFRHVRFEDLFSHCAAVVHHGGIGTLSKCLAAGVPQLIVPRSHDQPDNASRAQKMGVSIKLNYKALDTQKLTLAVRELFNSSAIRERCVHFKNLMALEHVQADSLDWLESFLKR